MLKLSNLYMKKPDAHITKKSPFKQSQTGSSKQNQSSTKSLHSQRELASKSALQPEKKKPVLFFPSNQDGLSSNTVDQKKMSHQIDAAIQSNKKDIKDLMKLTADVVQQPDLEKQYLLKNIIFPRDLKRYSMTKYVSKTFQINIGNMYFPITFHFQDYVGDIVVYVSMRERIPNKVNGYHEKFENQANCKYPKNYLNAKPGTVRIATDKIIFLTVECSESCDL